MTAGTTPIVPFIMDLHRNQVSSPRAAHHGISLIVLMAATRGSLMLHVLLRGAMLRGRMLWGR